MRRMVLAMMIAGVVQGAQAADYPDDLPVLRGSFREGLSTRTRNWDGYYAGGQIGFTAANMDFSGASSGLTSFMLRNSVLEGPVSGWSVLGRKDISSTGFGGFVGRNWQWGDAVLGAEANYNHYTGLRGSSVDSLSRSLTNPGGIVPPAGHSYVYDVSLSGAATMQIHDVMTFRARAGWAGGNFMPYMFAGLAVARVDVARSASVTSQATDVFDGTDPGGNPIHTETPLSSFSLSKGESRSNNFVAGYTAGLGTEYAIVGGLFARAEWEYIKFMKLKDISASMNTVRVGLGYKF